MRVRALERFEYAAVLRLPGDEFDTDSVAHAEILALARRVEIVPDGKVITTRHMTAEAKRNRYRHRAMRADE
jgi:hypothetical protein